MGSDYFRDVGSAGTGSGEGGRSVRNIAIPIRKRSNQRNPNSAQKQSAAPGKSRFGLWIVAFILIVILFGTTLMFLSRGTVITIVPREHTVVFDDGAIFTAFPQGDNAPEGVVLYSMKQEILEATAGVEARSTERVEERASGKITIVNEHSKDALHLIKNTRFETPAGLIYRIRNSVDVPGKQGSTAGTLKVTVYADEAGERYNVGPVGRFTLPGLKTSAPEMFNSVYARSDANMAGGFVGERPIVTESEQNAARETLRSELEKDARAALLESTENGALVFPEFLTITFESLPPEFDDGGSVQIRERATASVPVFLEDTFTPAIARETSADAGNGTITIPDTSTFSATLIDTGSINLGSDPIGFSLQGSARFVWNIDIEKLASDLAGTPESSFTNIMGTYDGIEEADARIRPFWSKTLPSDPNDITVKITEG